MQGKEEARLKKGREREGTEPEQTQRPREGAVQVQGRVGRVESGPGWQELGAGWGREGLPSSRLQPRLRPWLQVGKVWLLGGRVQARMGCKEGLVSLLRKGGGTL